LTGMIGIITKSPLLKIRRVLKMTLAGNQNEEEPGSMKLD
jgi:hypothetical protein